MVSPVRVLTLEMHVRGMAPGVWCDRCALPSAVRYLAVLVSPTTLRRMGRLDRVQCSECEWGRRATDDDPEVLP